MCARAQRENKLQKDVNSDLGKWLLCRLMARQGYSGTEVAKHMEKNEASTCTHTNLDEDAVQNIEAVKPAPMDFPRTL